MQNFKLILSLWYFHILLTLAQILRETYVVALGTVSRKLIYSFNDTKKTITHYLRSILFSFIFLYPGDSGQNTLVNLWNDCILIVSNWEVGQYCFYTGRDTRHVCIYYYVSFELYQMWIKILLITDSMWSMTFGSFVRTVWKTTY